MNQREIKFRGMGIKGQWYFGNLAIITIQIGIAKEIYEGDIVIDENDRKEDWIKWAESEIAEYQKFLKFLKKKICQKR